MGGNGGITKKKYIGFGNSRVKNTPHVRNMDAFKSCILHDLKASMFLTWGVFLTRELKNPMGKFNFFRLQQLLSRDNITNLG